MPKKGTYLGFDFGTKRLGLAIGQSITKTATPLMTLHVQNGTPWDQLSHIIKEWEPIGLVIGLALQPDNTHSKTSLLAQQLGHQLKAHFHLPVYFIEERLTSVAAREKYPQGDKDASAAAIILESWLNSPEDNDVSI